MALLFMEGFENYGTSDPPPTMHRRMMTFEDTAPSIVEGRFGGNAVAMRYGRNLATPSLTTDSTFIIGFALKITEGYTGYSHVFRCFSGNTMGMVFCPVSGEFQVKFSNTLRATTVGVNWTYNQWMYVEFKTYTDNTAGAWELRVNGVTVASESGVDTQAENTFPFVQQMGFWPVANANTYHLDDIYVLDGTAGLNDFLGDSRVVRLDPAGDAGTNQWTPASGTDHYAMVDDGGEPDDDTTYLESDTTDQLDLFTYGDTVEEGTIHGVQITAEAKVTEASGLGLKNVAKLGATQSDGSALWLPSEYTHARRIMEADPTGAAWTKTNLNNTQFGLKVG